MPRMFDKRTSWLDDEGKPLIGRVKFCKLHTTILENIYNMNGTVVYANPQYTNTIGQLQRQIFLKDNTDYTVRFEKYVGNGDMTEDQDNWLDVYSCDDIWNTYGIEIDATSFQVVNNITDLRNIDPSTVATRDGRKVIILGGYNVIGDKPEVMYIWNPNNTTSSDNGGDIIKVNNISNGRWELVNNFGSDGLDVRHFGVFGVDSKSEATDLMSIQINVANQYAAYNSIPLYFPAIDGLTWYKMNGLNLYNSIFAEETRVFGNTNYPNVITMNNENGYLDVYTDSDYKAVFTIRGSTVRTSWGVNSDNCIFEPSYKLIVDSSINTNNRDFSNIIVELIHETSNLQFDNCEIHSVNKLGDYIYFKTAKITESMFTTTTDYNTITIDDDVIFDLADWPTTWKWLILRSELSRGALDMQGRTLDTNCNDIVNWAGDITYKNAIFSSGFEITQSIIGLENCGGAVQFNNSLQTLICDNCDLSITTVQNARPNTVIKNNSTIAFTNGGFYAGEFALQDSTVHGNVDADVHVVGSNSVFDGAIAVNGILNLQRCTISGAIAQASKDANFNVILLNNTLGGSYYMFGAALTQSVVTGKIEYNNSSATQGAAIIIDRSNFDPDESHHNYSYKYNTGAFIPDQAVVQGTYLAKPRHYYSASENTFAQNNQAYHAFVVPTSLTCGLIYNTTVPFENVQFFTIGTTNINVKMKVRTMVNARTIPTAFTEIILKGIHGVDYTWGLVAHTNGTWTQVGNYYTWGTFPVLYPTMFIDGSAVKVEESSTLPSDYNIDMIIEYDILR